MLLTRKEDLSSPYYANLHAQHFSPAGRGRTLEWAEPKPKFRPAVWPLCAGEAGARCLALTWCRPT